MSARGLLEQERLVDAVAEDVETLHLVCVDCHDVDPESPTLCGLLDEPEVENKDYQNCVVCFTILNGNVCAKGHVLRL